MRSKSERVMRSAALNDGFTVVEFVAAAVILFIVLTGILGAVEYAGASTRMASVRQGAIDIAQEQIEYDRTRTWTDIGVVGGNPAGTIPTNQTISTDRGVYTVSTIVSWNPDPEDTHTVSTKEVSVRVAWSTPTVGSVALETAVFGRGTTGNLGDVQIIAVDDDHRTVKLKDIVFTLNPSGGTAVTNVNGVARWSGVTPSPPTYTLTGSSLVPGDWLVPSPVPGVPGSVVAGWQDWGFVYCVKPCVANFHVKSSSGASLANATVVLKDSDTSRPSTVSGVTDANGNIDFGMLWKTYSGSYTATATWGSAVSPVTTFTLATGGLAYPGGGNRAELVIPDPPSIKVSLVASTTAQEQLSGNTWTVNLKNPSGVSVLGTVTTSADFYTFPISVQGTYTAIVKNVTNSGVVSFLDNPGFKFWANGTDSNQDHPVPVAPLYRVCVRQGGPLMPSGYATISVPATMTIQNATTFATASVGNTLGVASFVVAAGGNYNRTVLINRITYPLTGILQSYLDASDPPPVPDYIDLLAGGFTITVTPGLTGDRNIGLYDSYGEYVAVLTATVATPTVTFLVPGGTYTAAVCKSSANPPRNAGYALPSGAAYKYLTLVVPSNGTTVSGTSLPPN